jgi:hypothetical protein
MKHAGSGERGGDHLWKKLAWPTLAVTAAVLLEPLFQAIHRRPAGLFGPHAGIRLRAGSILISFHVWQSKRSGDKAPLLLASDQAGDNGIPDLAVSFWTHTFTTVALVPDTLNFAASSDSHFGGNGGRDYVARNYTRDRQVKPA